MGARIAVVASVVLIAVAGVVLALSSRGPSESGATSTSTPEALRTTTSAPTTTSSSTTPSTVPPDAVTVEPGDDIQSLVDSHPAGTTFYLRAGTHTAPEVESHIVPKEGDSFIGEAGAILDGRGETEYAFIDTAGPVANVTIQGLIIENYASPVQRAAIDAASPGWRVLRNEIRANAAGGINLRAPDLLIEGNFVHHNEQIGVKVQDAHGSQIVGNEISDNNPNDAYDPSWEAGGTKFLRSTGLYIALNHVHDNHGPGLWTDDDNFEIVYERNTVTDNTGPGILHEISGSAEIEGNVVTGNAHGFYLGGILVANSSEVTVTGNTVTGNDGGIVGLQDDREEWVTLNLSVSNNVVAFEDGVTGVIVNGGEDVTRSGSIRFFSNDYTTSVRQPFVWGRRDLTVAQWQAIGQDENSTFN